MSKYLSAFRALAAERSEAFQIQGDRLLVEEIKPEEIKTKSGIMLASSLDGFGRNKDGIEANRAVFARVLAAGPGFVDEDGKNVDVQVQPGDVVLASPNSVLWFSTFMNNIAALDTRIGLMRESDIHLRFVGESAYDDVRVFLKAQIEKDEATAGSPAAA